VEERRGRRALTSGRFGGAGAFQIFAIYRVCLVWLLPPKSQKSNQRVESGKQLFLKADFLVVQN
jgi:hypothetical protein